MLPEEGDRFDGQLKVSMLRAKETVSDIRNRL
jgi:hypothetical protein